MNNVDRIYKINSMLQSRGTVTIAEFLIALEISEATFKRDIKYMRETLNAPLIYDHDSKGYRFEKQGPGRKYELPGLWFSQEETTALVTMQYLLSSLDHGGFIGPHIAPLMTKIDALLGQGETSSKELRKRIKVIPIGNRKTSHEFFSEIGNALLKRERLHIIFHGKGKDETTERVISPQRLIHYRENWYLDAYCHLRMGLRSFALDGIKKVILLADKCIEVPEKEMVEHFTESYGIFSGKADKTAKLRFSPKAARWVANESWHPKQRGVLNADGSYTLQFEYSQDPELMMDILKYGKNVEVLEPKILRERIFDEIKELNLLYK
jgi:predicted DNA-binding transcriptional regulator YafY